MLEATTCVADKIQHVVVRIIEATPHDLACGLDDLLNIGSSAIDIEEGRVAFEH